MTKVRKHSDRDAVVKDGVFDKARGRVVGSQEYLTKPFTKDQLLHAVQAFGASKQGVA